MFFHHTGNITQNCHEPRYPIEHMWPRINTQLGRLVNPPGRKLEIVLSSTWLEIHNCDVKNLMDSITRQVAAPIEARG